MAAVISISKDANKLRRGSFPSRWVSTTPPAPLLSSLFSSSPTVSSAAEPELPPSQYPGEFLSCWCCIFGFWVRLKACRNPYLSALVGIFTLERESRSSLSKWLLFLPGAITFGLGTWQIFRREDKVLFFFPLFSLCVSESFEFFFSSLS